MAEMLRKRLEDHSSTELFQKIGDICATVNTVSDEDELLQISLERTMELFGAVRGSIFILNNNRKELILRAVRGITWAQEEKMIKQLGEGIVGKVAVSKKPIFVDDIANDERFHNYKARRSYRSPSFLCVPLIIKDVLVGVINIADKDSGLKFSETELQLLDFLSSQIALNYRRVQLYQKFKTIVKESRSLKDELGKSSKQTDDLKRQIELQEKLASVGKLAGGIAHEFNNPLDGVMRYTNLCLESTERGGEGCDVCRGYLLEIKHGLNRMANIVRSLLACSRSSAPTLRKILPGEAVRQVIKNLQTDVCYRDITVQQKLAHDLPDVTDLGFDRIVSNLIRNAMDAVEEKGKIEVRCRQDYDRLILEVEDDGCGIPQDCVDTIFEPFYTTKDIAKGCGLGLTIVSEIVKAYNGRIDVQTKEECGTTFVVTIPVK